MNLDNLKTIAENVRYGRNSREELYREMGNLILTKHNNNIRIYNVKDIADLIRLGRDNSDIDAFILHVCELPHIDDENNCIKLISLIDDFDFYRPLIYSDMILRKLTVILYKYQMSRYDELFHKILARSIVNHYIETQNFIKGNRKIVIPKQITSLMKNRYDENTIDELLHNHGKYSLIIKKMKTSYNDKLREAIELMIE